MPPNERKMLSKYDSCMDRFEARKAIVKDLQDQGYMLKVDPIVHSVGHQNGQGTS